MANEAKMRKLCDYPVDNIVEMIWFLPNYFLILHKKEFLQAHIILILAAV